MPEPNPFKAGMNVFGPAFLHALVDLWDMACRNRIVLSPQSGIGGRQTASGVALYAPPVTYARVAKTTGSGITAMTGATPGSGTCTLQDFDGTTLTDSAGPDVTVYNILRVTVGATAPAYIQVKPVYGKYYFVDTANCGA